MVGSITSGGKLLSCARTLKLMEVLAVVTMNSGSLKLGNDSKKKSREPFNNFFFGKRTSSIHGSSTSAVEDQQHTEKLITFSWLLSYTMTDTSIMDP